jgi:hypothetical protein
LSTPTCSAQPRAAVVSIAHVGWRHRTFALPVWTDKQRLPAQVNAGTVTLTGISTAYFDFDPNGLVILWSDAKTYESGEILSMTANSITLKNGLQKTWAKGSYLMPARLASLSPAIDTQALTGTIENAQLVWNLQANQRSTNRAVSVASTQYLGYDIYTTEHDYSQAMESESEMAFEVIDFDNGGFSYDSIVTAPQVTFDNSLLHLSRVAIANFTAWLNARAGRFGQFWVTTNRRDMTLVQDAAATTTSIKIEDISYSSLVAQNPARRDICIRLANGTRLYRRIVSTTRNNDGTETLNLDAQLGVALSAAVNKWGNAADGHMISFLKFCRLSSDQVELAWLTDQKMRVGLKFTELLTTP